MKEIQLNTVQKHKPNYMKYVALIDDDDYDRVMQHNWNVDKGKYVLYAASRINGIKIKLHRFIMNAEKGQSIDHKDMDGLNCQKYNLRFCSNYQNQCNKKGRGKSKYLGVTIAIHGDAYYVDGVRYYTEKREKYVAAIRKNGKRHYIGQFNVEEDAARAYDKMAKEFHGEFARINFPE